MRFLGLKHLIKENRELKTQSRNSDLNRTIWEINKTSSKRNKLLKWKPKETNERVERRLVSGRLGPKHWQGRIEVEKQKMPESQQHSKGQGGKSGDC